MITGGTFGSTNAAVKVTKPDGSQLTVGTTYCGTSCIFDTTTLPVDGTYKLTVTATVGQDRASSALTVRL